MNPQYNLKPTIEYYRLRTFFSDANSSNRILSIGFPVSNHERNPSAPQIIQEASFSPSQKPLVLHLFHGFTSRFGANHLNSSLLEPSYHIQQHPQIDSFVFSTVESLTKLGFRKEEEYQRFIERIFNISSGNQYQRQDFRESCWS